MRRVSLALLALVGALALAIPAAFAKADGTTQAAPGITAKTITIGETNNPAQRQQLPAGCDHGRPARHQRAPRP